MLPILSPGVSARLAAGLRLHPDDYYALGTNRGSIKERWFSSVIPAMNGEFAPADEGMSYVSPTTRKEDLFLFRDAVQELGAEIIGPVLLEKYGTWPMYSKFFDYKLPLFHHLHLLDADARRVGRSGKPEAYYFPPQLNNHLGDFPVTYFGFDPDVSKTQVREKLLEYETGDNRITELSRAFRIQLGTGWYTPPGVVHAPGSVLTYEPQWNSDVTRFTRTLPPVKFIPTNSWSKTVLKIRSATSIMFQPDGLGKERRPTLPQDLLPPAAHLLPFG